jgi:hypothetical protein
VLYLLYGAALFVFQRSMLFPRQGLHGDSGLPDVGGLRQQWLQSNVGRVETWYLPPVPAKADVKSPAVIFAHGNGELIDDWPVALAGFRELGMGVLLVEYPGYGRSTGAPTQESIQMTFLAAYDLLASEPGIDSGRIVGFGNSLGGGAVCQLLRERPLAALILKSTFTSMRPFARRYMVPSFLIRDPFDNLAALARYRGPVLVIHGTSDELIPSSQGATIAAATKGELRLYDCGHNCWDPDRFPFWSDVTTFLTKNGILARSL